MRAICSSRSQKKVRRTKRNMANRIVKKKCKKMGYLKNVAFLMDLLWLMPPPAYKVTQGSTGPLLEVACFHRLRSVSFRV